MMPDELIPAGHTSLVKGGAKPLQVQTEYTYRPDVRITTTVFLSGQVLYKVVKKLDRAIQSAEEQSKVETVIKRQHAEVVAIIRDQSGSSLSARLSGRPDRCRKNMPVINRIKSIPGTEHVYHLDSKGNFVGRHTEKQFKKVFSALLKSLNDLLEVFALLPDCEMQRERGIYEVERSRLYLVSTGRDYYFITVRSVDQDADYESAIKQAVFVE